MVRAKYADDLSGTGSALYGGRWNPRGVYVLYASVAASLAMLEWLVNATEADSEESYCMLKLSIPESPVLKYALDALPSNWRNYPPPDYLQSLGLELVTDNQFLAMEVPSVVLPMENNLIINTRHPAFSDIKVIGKEILQLDDRMFGK
jgi:RES domain-containing protein